jgi:hypothetical protein
MTALVKFSVLAVSAAVLAGCASSKPTVTPTSPGSAQSAFPLSVTRTGGIAGFQDTVVVNPDGAATVAAKAASPRACQLASGLLGQLMQAASAIEWNALPSPDPKPQHPDDLVVLVSTPQGAGRVDAPALRSLQKPVADLLTLCTAR